MLGQFLDRLNLRLKNSEDKIKEKEKETRTNNKALPPKSTQPHPSRIASLSPETTSHSTQYHFRQYSPTATSRTNTGKPLLEEAKSFNPSGIIPKRYGEDKTPSHYHPTPTNMSRVLQPNKPEIHREKPKNVPNFEFRPLDKESFATSSANTSMREGSIIVQSIRPSQMVTASNKLIFGGIRQVEPKSPEHKGMTPGNKISKPAKDNSLDKTPKINYQEINPVHFETANQRRQHAWQEWWNEKKQNNLQLIEAARLGNLKLASQLLDKRKGDLVAHVNGKADNDWTPLHFACLNGDSEFVNLLLLNEANIDAETTLKFTPLHVAAQKGHAEIVQLLANSGADINCKDLYNNTPIHYAAQNEHKRIVQLLLSRPSLDLDIKNNDNKLAYDLAANSEIKRIFEAFIAEKNILNSNFTKKVTIHNTKAESIQKMFESAMSNKHPMQLQQTRSTENVPNKKPPAYGTTFTVSGDTKHSSVNSSDSDIANNENNLEEEKIGPHSFTVHSMIGKGSFGEVYLVEKKNTNTYYAMKVLHKTRIAKHNLVRYVMTERNVLSVTNHPFIVKLIYAFQTPDKLFLIMDYCPGGDLGEHLQKERRFTEDKARFYLAEITLALEDLHKRDIIFRDLKPDNIVLDANGHAMLTDFGLSKEGVLDQVNGARSFCGSVAYLAPEMLKRVGHGKAVDWYLLGVVFYEMLVGVPPYYANNREELFANIEKAPLKIPSKISAEAKSLLVGLLQRNPAKRLGAGKGDAEEIKAHPFFAKLSWEEVEKKKLKMPIPEKRINFAQQMSINPFGGFPQESPDDNRIVGWSFVAPRQQEPNN